MVTECLNPFRLLIFWCNREGILFRIGSFIKEIEDKNHEDADVSSPFASTCTFTKCWCQLVPTCSMGGLVVKQMLYQAKEDNMDDFVNNTIGVVCVFSSSNRMEFTYAASTSFSFCLITVFLWFQAFYSCPHFGSKLADLPWRMGLVLRPAPTVSSQSNICKEQKEKENLPKVLGWLSWNLLQSHSVSYLTVPC